MIGMLAVLWIVLCVTVAVLADKKYNQGYVAPFLASLFLSPVVGWALVVNSGYLMKCPHCMTLFDKPANKCANCMYQLSQAEIINNQQGKSLSELVVIKLLQIALILLVVSFAVWLGFQYDFTMGLKPMDDG